MTVQIRTHNHLDGKRTLNHLAKLFHTYSSDMATAPSKEFLDIQAIECKFTLKFVRDMIIAYSQLYNASKIIILNVSYHKNVAAQYQ